MPALASHVADAEHGVAGEFVLNAQTVLVDLGPLAIGRYIGESYGAKGPGRTFSKPTTLKALRSAVVGGLPLNPAPA